MNSKFQKKMSDTLMKKLFTHLKSGDITESINLIQNCGDIATLKYGMYDDTALIIASRFGHLRIVKILLEKGSDVNYSGFETALIVAAGNNHVEVVQFLLKNGANINLESKNGSTPLNKASHFGHHQVVQILIDHGVDLSAKNKDCQSALFRCIFSSQLLEKGQEHFMEPGKYSLNHDLTAELLISSGANLNVFAAPDGGWEVLTRAAHHGHIKTIEAVIKRVQGDVNRPNKRGITLFMLAAMDENEELMNILIKMGADINSKSKKGNSALKLAMKKAARDAKRDDFGFEETETVEFLMKKGANIKTKRGGRTMLMWAAARGHEDLVEEFIQKGDNVNDITFKGETAIALAIKNNHMDLVQQFLGMNAKVTVGFPLVEASAKGKLELVKELVSRGSKLNQIRPKDGFTPLIAAVANAKLEVTNYLLDQGSNINQMDATGMTALYHVMLNYLNDDSEKIAKILIKKGINIDSQDKDGNTALMVAFKYGTWKHWFIELFLKKGASVNIRNKEGVPALGIAIERRRDDMQDVEMLMEKKADLDFVFPDGKTPVMLALFLKKRELAELLIKCGADTSSVDRDGDSALIYAVKMGYLKTAETLMKTAPARQCKKVLFVFEKMKKRPVQSSNPHDNDDDDDDDDFYPWDLESDLKADEMMDQLQPALDAIRNMDPETEQRMHEERMMTDPFYRDMIQRLEARAEEESSDDD